MAEESSSRLARTGQSGCHDQSGRPQACAGSGQDGERQNGVVWPEPRFMVLGEAVCDRLTGLGWLRDANIAGFPLAWQEALDFVAVLGREGAAGYHDWRLPNRRELLSLLGYATRKPALPEGHPFINVFPGWYWSATSAAINPAYAWYLHLDGGRLFYGGKRQYYLLWPVRGRGNGLLAQTGQQRCYDAAGREIACDGSGQDGELQLGRPWPRPRFMPQGEAVLDRSTGLRWRHSADLTGVPVPWSEALAAARRLNEAGEGGWRLPNINELESLVDASRHSPALPADHPFREVREGYWSSTTSVYEPDWAWALYLTKGALGVGQKRGAYFYVWAVK